MRNIKITAQLQNGNKKETPIIGIFDFIPFVKIATDSLNDCKIIEVKLDEAKVLSNLL